MAGKARAAAVAALVTLAAPATAGEAIVGFGADDVFDSAHASLLLELRAEPRWHLGTAALGFGMGGEIDTQGDLWGGAGLYLTAPLDHAWRLEASIMPGGYSQGSSGTDLGSSFPMIRSQIGLSYLHQPSGWRIGAVLSHKSNASTSSDNPGNESAHLTFGRSF